MFRLIVAGVIAAAVCWFVDPTLFIEIAVPLFVYEIGAVTSAMLDYRESRLACVGWAQWWAVGHATVFARLFKRTRHVYRGAVSAWHRRQLRKATTKAEDGYVVLDPAAPFTGRVIDPEPQGAKRETA